jgi:hypothetical protein
MLNTQTLCIGGMEGFNALKQMLRTKALSFKGANMQYSEKLLQY